MTTQQPPTIISADGADPIGQRVHWGTMGFSLTIYSLLLYQVWVAVSAAIRFQDSPYFTKWAVMSLFFSLGAVWCGALIWQRRRRDQHSVYEICLAMFLVIAVTDSLMYWQGTEKAMFPWPMWFCVFCYVFILVLNKFAKKRPEPSAPSVDLAMQLDDDPQALLKHRDTRNADEPPNP
jgi:hypothetical protein